MSTQPTWPAAADTRQHESDGPRAGHASRAVPHPPATAPDSSPPRLPGFTNQALLGQRSALIFLLGILVATGAGILTYFAVYDTATALLAAGGAFPGAVLFFHTIIAP